MTITQFTKAEFRAIPFSVGGYSGTSPLTNAPTLTPASNPTGITDGSEVHQHLLQKNPIPLKWRVGVGAHVGQQHISFIDSIGEGGAHDAYYLPFQQQNISSMRIGTACDLFFTDNLSGCSIYVDAKPGEIVVYHANIFGGQFNADGAHASDFGYERPLTVAYKRQMHDHAMAHYPGTTNRLILTKSMYWAKGNAAAKTTVKQAIGLKAKIGGLGTTVVGFRIGNVWDFWWQSWSVDLNGSGRAKLFDSGSFGTVAI